MEQTPRWPCVANSWWLPWSHSLHSPLFTGVSYPGASVIHPSTRTRWIFYFPETKKPLLPPCGQVWYDCFAQCCCCRHGSCSALRGGRTAGPKAGCAAAGTVYGTRGRSRLWRCPAATGCVGGCTVCGTAGSLGCGKRCTCKTGWCISCRILSPAPWLNPP